MNYVLGGRSIGAVLGRSQGAAVLWYLSGGVSAANAIAVYQPKGAASLAASYTNLANPGTYNAAPGTAPTFDTSTGWTFAAASSQYLTTGITASTGWSAIVRFSNVTNGSSSPYLFGSSGFGIRPAGASTNHSYANAGSLTITGNVTSGVMAVTTSGYLNGVSEGSITPGSAPANAIVIGAINTGSPILFVSAKIQALAIYNTTLSAAQVAAISTAMAAL